MPASIAVLSNGHSHDFCHMVGAFVVRADAIDPSGSGVARQSSSIYGLEIFSIDGPNRGKAFP